ncbi:MAG: Bax inhibitor-1/YccA family protein [Bacilli bacterium]
MSNKIFPKVFMWMFIGLLISFGTGYFVYNNPNMLYNIFSTSMYYIIIIVELLIVIFLSARIQKMNPLTAMISFVLYSVVTGLTLSIVFVMFEMSSIIYIFLITAFVFLIFALLGYFTKIDLSKYSTIFLMGLFGIIIATIVNIFLNNATFDIILSWIGVVLFVGLVAYDIQKIKRYGEIIDDDNKIAIIGALDLYLDFINIFLRLLNLFGKNKN